MRAASLRIETGVEKAARGYPGKMLSISPDTLREGCDRAHDLFTLNSMRRPEEAADSFDAVFEALGFDQGMRARLQDTLTELVPVKGDPMLEANTTMSMAAGVLIGLLIADSTLPADELDLPLTAP
jgi:hypothetical protein